MAGGMSAQPIRSLPKVALFLSAKKRDSHNTASSYGTGLTWMAEFLAANHPDYNLESIIEPLKTNKLDFYVILDEFITFLSLEEFSASTIQGYLYSCISYFLKYDIDINPYKLKSRVSIPKIRRDDAYPIDLSEARIILSNLKGGRLRAFTFLEASFGARPIEVCALRACDVDRTVKPYKYKLRKEFSKNRIPREVYGTIESDKELDIWIGDTQLEPNELLFSSQDAKSPLAIYSNLVNQFGDHLDGLGMGERIKPDEPMSHRKISFYSFRRFVETTVEDNTSANFADYILGHKKSPYYNKKEPERRALWMEKCHNRLIYLDYDKLDLARKQERIQLATYADKLEERLWKKIEVLEAEIASMRKPT